MPPYIYPIKQCANTSYNDAEPEKRSILTPKPTVNLWEYVELVFPTCRSPAPSGN